VHLRHLLADVGPQQLLVVAHRGDHVDVQRVHLLEQIDLLLHLRQLGVVGARQAEELLAGVVLVPPPLLVLVAPLELLQPLVPLHRRDPRDGRAVGAPVVVEGVDVGDERLHRAYQFLLEGGLPRGVGRGGWWR